MEYKMILNLQTFEGKTSSNQMLTSKHIEKHKRHERYFGNESTTMIVLCSWDFASPSNQTLFWSRARLIKTFRLRLHLCGSNSGGTISLFSHKIISMSHKTSAIRMKSLLNTWVISICRPLFYVLIHNLIASNCCVFVSSSFFMYICVFTAHFTI